MKTIPVLLKFGGPHKESKRIRKELSRSRKGSLHGYTEARIKPDGFVVWVRTTQTDREFVDSFFHEMTHLLLRLRFAKKNFVVPSSEKAERVAGWIGYWAKLHFADMWPSVFGRKG